MTQISQETAVELALKLYGSDAYENVDFSLICQAAIDWAAKQGEVVLTLSIKNGIATTQGTSHMGELVDGTYSLYTTPPQAVNAQLVEALEKSLAAMEMTVHFRETGRGRPPEQTCMLEIEGARAALAAAKESPAPRMLSDAEIVSCVKTAGYTTWDSRVFKFARAILAAAGARDHSELVKRLRVAGANGALCHEAADALEGKCQKPTP